MSYSNYNGGAKNSNWWSFQGMIRVLFCFLFCFEDDIDNSTYVFNIKQQLASTQ